MTIIIWLSSAKLYLCVAWSQSSGVCLLAMKKPVFILSLFFAFTVVMAHDILPHDHHSADYPASRHAGNKETDDALAHNLGLIHHAGPTIQYVVSNASAKTALSFFHSAFIQDQDSGLPGFRIGSATLFDLSLSQAPYFPPISLPSGLRAPPVIS
jgi:hypothetical protein